jgi:hypothetical protein
MSELFRAKMMAAYPRMAELPVRTHTYRRSSRRPVRPQLTSLLEVPIQAQPGELTVAAGADHITRRLIVTDNSMLKLSTSRRAVYCRNATSRNDTLFLLWFIAQQQAQIQTLLLSRQSAPQAVAQAVSQSVPQVATNGLGAQNPEESAPNMLF